MPARGIKGNIDKRLVTLNIDGAGINACVFQHIVVILCVFTGL